MKKKQDKFTVQELIVREITNTDKQKAWAVLLYMIFMEKDPQLIYIEPIIYANPNM